MPYRVPLWVRAFLAADRLATRLENAREGLRDELLLSWIPPADRPALTAALYASESTYLPGGHRFQNGLFGWERRVFESPPFPRSGRVLLGASGGGREIVGLVERGYEVVAFDPCAPFVEASRTVADPAKATVVLATYEDLVQASAGRGGPLAFTRDGPAFDAVVLGWGSFSHVAPRAARSALLGALHTLAPKAPVLASFTLDGDSAMTSPGRGHVREKLKRVFAALRAPGVSELGDHFYPNVGFISSLTTDELTASAWEAGYEVAHFEDSPYPHALLLPIGATRGANE